MQRREGGFTFIEILVVMGIIVVLMGMIAVVVPRVQEQSRRTQSIHNVQNLATLLVDKCALKNRWPRLSGKRFTLSVVGLGLIEAKNPDNLEVFFSPGDSKYNLDLVNPARYLDFAKKMDVLKNTDCHELTSYAGRRNGDDEYLLTPARMNEVVPIICDDDDGPLHHPAGLVIAYSDAHAGFKDWEELHAQEPSDPNNPEPFLGDSATTDILKGLSSD